ncbi:hypothetical protein IEE94_00850 [Yimella sp. cx-573]|nr:hypothetical protein [Yimella sp. cx-573]
MPRLGLPGLLWWTRTPPILAAFCLSNREGSRGETDATREPITIDWTSPIPKIDAPEWTDFKVKFLMAPNGFKPTKCYVGARPAPSEHDEAPSLSAGGFGSRCAPHGAVITW